MCYYVEKSAEFKIQTLKKSAGTQNIEKTCQGRFLTQKDSKL